MDKKHKGKGGSNLKVLMNSQDGQKHWLAASIEVTIEGFAVTVIKVLYLFGKSFFLKTVT